MTRNSDVAVIGAGIVGLAAAHELSVRGRSVTVFETGVPGFGQSAGQSRIFRHAHDDPRMVDLAVRARVRWLQWEDEFGTELLSRDGGLALGPSAIRRLEHLSAHPEVDARAVDSAELARLAPVLADYRGDAVFDATAGSIRTRAAIEAMSARYADYIVGEQVIAVRDLGGCVQIRCPTGVYEHGALVVAAGRGTAALASGLGLDLPIELGAHVRVSFAARTPQETMPTLQDGSDHFGFSGIYAAAYPDRTGYGLGLSDSVPAQPDGTIRDAATLGELADRAAQYVSVALPGLDPTPRDIVHCWVTTLPWGDDGVAIFSTGSTYVVAGHNLFKHAPVLGEALAQSVVAGSVVEGFSADDRLGASG
ncbi:NAD(P)/FAD-dependent oxidoreductase [Gordonia bronchialis]|uniref:NAD(P)/FAD-dependent oxidoreductase n=1 Tax=Gordonia bronchialis TaxID=2054 RepID=UPI00226FDA67|nr:FAD-dependent oxidoreductase [Gordonia bronchialis]